MLKQVVEAENIKIRRSLLLYLHLIVLFLFPILFGLYYGSRKQVIVPANMIIGFYEILAIASPIIISVVVCLVFDREEKAGNFKNWLTEPISKGWMIQAQLSYYWIWYVIEIMGTSLIFSGVLFGIYQIRFSLIKIALTSIAFSLCGIVQYELTQIIALRWGIGDALILGFFGTVISLLSITSLLDFVWPIIPWAWQIRLTTFWQTNIDLGLVKLSLIEYLIPLMLTCLIIFWGKRYFDNWQGKN